MEKQTQRQKIEVFIYTIFKAQSITSAEGDTSDWAFLATDHGNIWFNSKKELDASIKTNSTVELTVYKYLPGTHNRRTGKKNKNFNVYLDNSHLKKVA